MDLIHFFFFLISLAAEEREDFGDKGQEWNQGGHLEAAAEIQTRSTMARIKMERRGQIREDFGGRDLGEWIWEDKKRKMKTDSKEEWESMQGDIHSQVSKWWGTDDTYVHQGFTGKVPVKGINLGYDFKLE